LWIQQQIYWFVHCQMDGLRRLYDWLPWYDLQLLFYWSL
jgi:hypothetical protein